MQLQDIIGLPPGDDTNLGTQSKGPSMTDVITDTMPILEIIPAYPSVVGGLESFRLITGMGATASETAESEAGGESSGSQTGKSYRQELLQNYGVSISKGTRSIKIACLGNSFPVPESFTNDYTESKFQSLADVSSETVHQARFAFGVESVGDAGAVLDKVFGGIKGSSKAYEQGKSKAAEIRSQNENLSSAATTAAGLALGNKIDFPKIWKSSGWQADYNVNVRLYNPFPGSREASEKYIYAPLAAIMMFVVPRSEDGHSFMWPWLCKYKVPGLFNVQSGYIKSVSVIKGGDDNHIAYNHRPGIVDLKITLGTLYSTIVGGSTVREFGTPHLSDWLNEFNSSKGRWSDNLFTESLFDNARGPSWTRYGDNVQENTDQYFAGREIETQFSRSKSTLSRDSKTSVAGVGGGESAPRDTPSTRITPIVSSTASELAAANPPISLGF